MVISMPKPMPIKVWRITIELTDQPKNSREDYYSQEVIFDATENVFRDLPAGLNGKVIGVVDVTP